MQFIGGETYEIHINRVLLYALEYFGNGRHPKQPIHIRESVNQRVSDYSLYSRRSRSTGTKLWIQFKRSYTLRDNEPAFTSMHMSFASRSSLSGISEQLARRACKCILASGNSYTLRVTT